MCNECAMHEYVCPVCGDVQDPEYGHLDPYLVARRDIKNIVWTSSSENFVWLLRFEGRIVKVGYGSLMKLLNETRPNAAYIRFDTAIVYLCESEEERNAFACLSMGQIDGIVNRRGVRNNKYKTVTEMVWKNNPSMSVRNAILGDPDFKIGETGYYDMRKLNAYGVA